MNLLESHITFLTNEPMCLWEEVDKLIVLI